MFRNVTETFRLKIAAICGNGLDIFPGTVVTVPETFPDNSGATRTPPARRARKDSRCDAVSVPPVGSQSPSPRVCTALAAVLTAATPAAVDRAAAPAAHTVPCHDGLRRPRLHQELQPLHRDRPTKRRLRPGRVLRAADRHRRGWPQAGSLARPQLEMEQRQQDAHAEHRRRQVVGRQEADRRPTSSTASRPGARTS